MCAIILACQYFTLNFRCWAGSSSVGNIPHIAGWAQTVGGMGGQLTGDSDDGWMATPAGRADSGSVGNI